MSPARCLTLILALALPRTVLCQSAGGTSSMPAIAVGQEWHYHTRPGEETSTLVILRLETDSSYGDIVHIAIHGLHIKNARRPDGENTELPHAPISRAALIPSLTTLAAASVPVPDYKEGYQEWLKARGGVFSISVAEIVAYVEKALGGQ